ncbi:MAG: PEGA domain-containing protein [Polyangiaceae bacterium]|nr:PEGA domain-containing protein [Polyangiaceae bacterium]
MHREHRPPGTLSAIRVVRWASAALVAAMLLRGAPVAAQPRTGAAPASPRGSEAQSQRERAAARFDRGIQLYRAGRYAEAFDTFLEARKLYPSPAFSFNLGRCAERMKDTPSALRYYRQYVRESPYAEDLDQVTERIRSLEQTLATRGVQQVTVLSDPEGATVHVDETPVGITPWTGELAPGVHALKLARSGYEDAVEKLDLPAERAVDVSVRLSQVESEPSTVPAKVEQQPVPAPAAAPRPAESEAAHRSGAKIHVWTWGVLAGSAVALGGAGVYELFRRHSESEIPRHEAQLARLDEYQSMQDYQRNARVLLGIGSVLALVGGGLVLWDLSSGPAPTKAGAEHQARRPSRVVSAQVGCDGLVCGLFMRRRLE